MSIQFIGPVIILIYCYGKIAWILTRRIDSNLENKDNSRASMADSNMNNKFITARNNTIKTVLLVGLCFIVCWVNDEVYYLMFNLGYDADWNGTYFKFCVTMIYLKLHSKSICVFDQISRLSESIEGILPERKTLARRITNYIHCFHSYI